MKRSLIFMLMLFFSLTAFVPLVSAHCPLCTAAVGAGIVITRFYGVDDMIVGLWVGAFIISTALWFNNMLKKKYIPFQGQIVAILIFAATIISFYFGGLFNASRIFGVDKLLLGIIAGSILVYAGLFISSNVKQINKNKAIFPFQTIAFILALLAITSAIVWLAIR